MRSDTEIAFIGIATTILIMVFALAPILFQKVTYDKDVIVSYIGIILAIIGFLFGTGMLRRR